MDVASEQMKSKADNVAENLGQMGHKAVDAAQKKFQNMKDSASEYYDRGVEKAEEFQNDMQDYVREQPIKSVLMALGAGLLIGFFLSRR